MIKPDLTLIDHIVQGQTLILARQSPNQPFIFEPTEVLFGEAADAQIPYLVDSLTRRKLEQDPEAEILFVRERSGAWQRLALVDDPVSALLEDVLAQRVSWASGYPETRRALVAGLQGSSDPVLRDVVISEFDKMPYDALRRTDIRIPTERLLSDLWTRNGYRYQAIRVLLLGLIDDPAARREVEAYIAKAPIWERPANLGAFSAAYIEMNDGQGVQHLSETILLAEAQPLEKLEQVITAFSVVNRVASEEVRTAITKANARLIEQRPEAAVLIARHFTNQSDWSQSPVLMPLLQQGRLSARGDMLTVFAYVSQANRAPGARYQNPKTDG